MLGISARDFKEGRIELIVWSPAPFPVLRQAEEPWEQFRNLSCFKEHLPALGIKKCPTNTSPPCTCKAVKTTRVCAAWDECLCPVCQLHSPQMSECLLFHIPFQLFLLHTTTKAVPVQRYYLNKVIILSRMHGLIAQFPWEQWWKTAQKYFSNIMAISSQLIVYCSNLACFAAGRSSVWSHSPPKGLVIQMFSLHMVFFLTSCPTQARGQAGSSFPWKVHGSILQMKWYDA